MANNSHNTIPPENTPQVEENSSSDNVSSENTASSENPSASEINEFMEKQLNHFKDLVEVMERDMDSFRINMLTLLALSDAQSRHFRDAICMVRRDVFRDFESAHESQQEMADILSGKKKLSG